MFTMISETAQLTIREHVPLNYYQRETSTFSYFILLVFYLSTSLYVNRTGNNTHTSISFAERNGQDGG